MGKCDNCGCSSQGDPTDHSCSFCGYDPEFDHNTYWQKANEDYDEIMNDIDECRRLVGDCDYRNEMIFLQQIRGLLNDRIEECGKALP